MKGVGHNFLARLAVHGDDDVTAPNIWSQVNSLRSNNAGRPFSFNFAQFMFK